MSNLDDLKSKNFWGTLKQAPGKKRWRYIRKLLKESRNTNISVVMGVRRSGKSTILLQLIQELLDKEYTVSKNTLFINFEDPRISQLLYDNNLLNLVEEFYSGCDKRRGILLFLDEIQNVQNWEAVIRTVQDDYPKIKIYITGSSASLLGKELSTKLSGRYLSTEVFPISYLELQNFSKSKKINDLMDYGGFPSVIETKESNIKIQLLQDYFDSILIKDISFRYKIRHDYKLRSLAQLLFTNISSLASSYKFAKDLGITADTVLQYFKYIEDSYLGFFVPKFDNSLRKQGYNPKKFYGIDTGIHNATAFKVIDNNGKLFENIVFLELRRKYKDIYYWYNEKEVDFVIKQGEDILMLCNASYSIDNQETYQREIESLMEAMYQLNKNEAYLVIAKGENSTVETELGKIHIVTLGDFLLNV